MMGEEGKYFSLTPWGNNTLHMKGYDDGGVEYYPHSRWMEFG